MNKQLVQQTALCYWSAEDQCFLVRSPIFPRALGAGKTPAEAWEIFQDSLGTLMEALEGGRLYGWEGGIKPSVELKVKILPATLDKIRALADSYGCSEDEIVDFMAGYTDIAVLPTKTASN